MKASGSREMRISTIKKDFTERTFDVAAGGICLEADDLTGKSTSSPAETEESAFLTLRELVEARIDIHVTVIFKANLNSMGAEHVERIKAITRGVFRAAVYGSFSIMYDSVRSIHDYESFCDFINKIFCELESENREFNGYISKGIIIGTPSALSFSDLRGIDFLCIDLDRMIPYMLCNGQTKGGSRKLYLHGRFDLLCEALVSYFSELKCPIRLKTSDFASNSFIYTIATALSAEELIIQ